MLPSPLEDEALAEEIALLAEVIVAVAPVSSHLSQAEVDGVLGVAFS